MNNIEAIRHLSDFDIRELVLEAYKFCEKNKWDKGWLKGGCYLHLECSEFIEALRGKGDPEKEAADVLTAFLSMIAYNNIDISKVIRHFYCSKLKDQQSDE